MKPERKQKTTPEQSLRRACEEGMGLDLRYSEVRDRLDTAEIARVGKARQTAKTAKKFWLVKGNGALAVFFRQLRNKIATVAELLYS